METTKEVGMSIVKMLSQPEKKDFRD